MDAEQSSEEFDESDEMQFEIFNNLHEFYRKEKKNLPIHQDNKIMDL